MNSSNRPHLSLRWLTLAPLCFVLSVPFSSAQMAPAAPVEPAALAKYDKNNDGKLDASELAVMQADEARAKSAAAEPAAKPNDEVVQLSPFEVIANNKGYYGGNTMSGTRFNSKIEDLASAITVVTKEQMTDLAMLDINDVFLYTAGTEGTGTYTDFVVDRNGSVADNVQLNPTQANRIRGIAPANNSLGNIETMGRVPVDPIGIDSIEISRGPNANVFGLGNPSGTVNLVPSSANLTRDFAQVVFRADSYDGFRNSLDVNRVLLKGKLAIRASQVYQHEGFTRKPSGVDTERYNGMIKYQPFKNTTITGSYSYYKMSGTRPNFLPPRDNISYWIRNGKPTWDPVTMTIHVNGSTIGPITATTFPTTFAGQNVDYFSSGLLGGNHNQMFIDQTGLAYWSAPQDTSTTAILAGATVFGPTGGGTAARYLEATGAAGATGTAAKPGAQPLFTTTPSVSDKSIYNYSDINLSAVNQIRDRTLIGNVQIEQLFINTPMQTLAAQVAFMREDSQRYQRNLIGIANDLGQSGQLQIDINERRLDGTPNPFFLRPFIGTDKPRTTQQPAKWDTSRAQVAYRVDFGEAKSDWMKWLGTATVTGYAEYKYRVNRIYSFRDAIASPNPWIPPGVYRGNQSQVTGTPTLIALTQGLYRYYVGDNQGNNIDYAPSNFSYGTYPFVWVQSTAASAIVGVHSEPSVLAQVGSTDGAGGTNNSKTVLKTKGAILQSHLFGDRLVSTFGLRQDDVFSLFGGTPFLMPDGININYAAYDSWENRAWRTNGGHTKNFQFVVRPFMNMKALEQLDSKGGAGSFVAELIDGLSFNYNNSNSFLVSLPAQDLFLNPLPNPTGKDKSWGLGINLFKGKLVIRATHYDDVQKDARNGDANTIAQRVIRTDLPLASTTPARFVLQTVAGALTATTGNNNNSYGWIRATHPGFTDQQVIDELAVEMGMSTALQAALINPNPPVAATNDIISRGTEFEVNFNPTPYWTVAASVTEGRAITANVSTAVQQWINQRMPIWTTLVDPAASLYWTPASLAAEPQHLWWDHNYGGSQTAHQNFLAFVAVPYNVIQQLEGKSNPQVRRYNARISTNLRLAGISDNATLKKFSIGGAVRWEDKGAIGYQGVPDANGVYQSLDTTHPFFDKGHYFLDAFVNYKTKLWNNKIGTTVQLNVRNIQESGSLQPIGAFPDGTISTYRIVDPRLFILQVTFDL